MQINGQAAIVTGGASGMGAETARHLAKLGAKVTVLDMNEAAVKQVAEEIGGLGLLCDVSSAESAEKAVAEARAAHGPARIAVNCAGVAPAKRIVGRDGPMALDDFRKVIEVNLIGTFNMLRLAAADMGTLDPLESGERGVIVNTASVAAYEGQIGQAAYASSKGGIVALTICAARDLARSAVRVMTIAPGLIGTPMLLNMPQEVQDSLAATVPFPKRFGQPSEYARLVQHILENEMLNGEVIRLDGAIRMAPQ
ncbi:SDR family NAD(P)-dependent oxidoreductase [Azospirillum brasilense]|uniref:SDR family NAD(P)-dependent oxidoreductase n=2 Tax=Azospirillum brasilense TaxID=192 RepID=A0A0P0EKD9_AZOBR|nr:MULTISPECIES: SDR family NAD(P)-dependent oxidoreductase [Azospirillum]ALJ38421.1 3-hydroxy-2-methylbutyryl-CoA dehydrogenase [Azospirillum brasilense]MDW7554216.1 SDR family NAD(P)-dependent oxidoreductase [Azospirillum brasilense]MDW7594433.1 SDR family NAD(P)-dependent oxidoreductase [Azospirillum brasilense]MDW7630059.1 SDR family NAD(P)-dependent oxidoreductase [Azospirillum brasilense]MDX5955524.1 SDR family NAD(P)-dependent oxidoreductase [Azospirillum brasilense]